MRLAVALLVIGLCGGLGSACGGTTDEARGTPTGGDGGGAGTAPRGAGGGESSDGGASGEGASGSGGIEPAAGGSGGSGGTLQTGGTSAGVGGGLNTVCVPGEVRTCYATCGMGTWTCNASGTAFGVCTCPEGPEPLVAADFGDAGVAVTAEAFLAWRERECSGWSAEPEPLEQPCFFAIPIDLDGMPADTDQMVVMAWSESSDLIQILRNDSAECLDGWNVSDAGELVFCASTCNQLSLHPEARVELLFGCESDYVEVV